MFLSRLSRNAAEKVKVSNLLHRTIAAMKNEEVFLLGILKE